MSKKKKKSKPQPICPYCGSYAVLEPDEKVYGRSYGSYVWVCHDCKAWVGVHRNSSNFAPMGRLANAQLRQLKVQAHALFDPIWKAAMEHRGWPESKARFTAYQWLASRMGIDMNHCHIGMFDDEQCREAIAICSEVGKGKNDVHTA